MKRYFPLTENFSTCRGGGGASTRMYHKPQYYAKRCMLIKVYNCRVLFRDSLHAQRSRQLVPTLICDCTMVAQEGGGGYSNFFSIRRLGPGIYHSPPKTIRNFKHPQKIFEILATQKNIPRPFCTLPLRKDPIIKMHRNDPSI